MKIWIFDSQHITERRNWEENLGQPPEEFPNGSLNDVSSWEALDEPGIVVVHRSLESVTTSPEWSKIEEIIKRNRVCVIAVSGSGFGNDSSPDKNFYHRRQPVRSGPKSTDKTFAQCFGLFKEDLQKQLASGHPVSPNFSLLELPAAPEALLALYLCDVAGLELGEQQEVAMLKSAEQEFDTLADHKQLQANAAQSWDEVLQDRASGIGALLKQLERRD